MISNALQQLLARIRRRSLLAALLPVLPWLLALPASVWLDGKAWLPWAVATLGAAVLALQLPRLRRRLRQQNHRWLLARLADLRPDLEDSTDLLDARSETLSALQQAQRAIVIERLAAQPLPALSVPLPWRGGALSALLAAALLASAWLPADVAPASSDGPQQVAPATAIDQALAVQLRITPPPYTGLPTQQVDQLAVRVATGSLLHWSLGFALRPDAARLEFIDGSTLVLREEQGRFVGERELSESTLYRLQIDGAPAVDERLQRIDVSPDRAPTLRVLAPERSLTLLDSAQRQWELRVLAEDDYGLGPAQLRLTLAQGSGEQVAVSEQTVQLRGDGDARRREYRHIVDLGALGYGRGDDLIARLEVRDNRQPNPQLAQTAALILRWPNPPSAEGSGVDGLVQRALPAYFRSQRQIIIDTEALIAERPRIDPPTLVDRADAIGVDQRILRLRYGQFLGEEAESGDLPGSGPRPDSESDADAEHADGDEHDHAGESHHAGDGHDHGDAGTTASAGFGDAGNLLAEVGHLHDIAEAATLLDPRTRSLLRAALREMWSAEGELRLGQPEAALPFEYRALELIKQVQQANRIYLARVGLELPPVDFSRRLSGEDRPQQRPVDPLVAAQHIDAPIVAWWRALESADGLPLDEIATWLAQRPDALEDPLGALAEIDGLRRDPDCDACRQRLQRALWPALPPPSAAPLPRSEAGSSGERYLQLLEQAGSAP